jgi:DNA-binding XRE family transcriptional regulator
VRLTQEQKIARREQFKMLRENAGLSKSELGFLIGMTDDNIGRIERGRGDRFPTGLHIRLVQLVLFIAKVGILDQLKVFLKKSE